ncbi:MAG: GtrA family protein [Muribaculaceae bacterium]|nr:GtrA family protein [Muribaculaceae bacterium]
MPDRPAAMQFIKFCLVGAMNTLVTLCTIFICKSLLGMNEYVANAIGYVLGVINSFLWNKQWVFRSHGRFSREAIRFALGFAVCYSLQLLTVVALNTSSFGKIEVDTGIMVVSGYGFATLIGCGVYTVTNFIYNRLITFRKQ